VDGEQFAALIADGDLGVASLKGDREE